MRLELPPISSDFPQHWLKAALPQAQVCQLQEPGLVQLASAALIELDSPLCSALRAAVASTHTLIAIDAGGAPWRLHRNDSTSAGIWLLQSLDESRRLSLQNLRTACAAKLADSLLHELRNPLNALGLQCDLLGRSLKAGAGSDTLVQAPARIAQMKDRLRDLLERQNSLVGLWLAEVGAETPGEIAALVDEALRLLRSYGSQHEIRLQAEDLSKLDPLASPGNGVAFRIVLLAIGMLAIDGAESVAAADETTSLLLRAGADDDASTVLEIQAPFIAAAAFADLQLANFDECLATLALLLDGLPIELGRSASNDSIHLRFLARPA